MVPRRTVPRSKMCTFAALALAYGSSRGLTIGEASYELVDLLIRSDIPIYDGITAGFPLPVPDGDCRRTDDEFPRTDFILKTAVN